jgi:hypothetical protein
MAHVDPAGVCHSRHMKNVNSLLPLSKVMCWVMWSSGCGSPGLLAHPMTSVQGSAGRASPFYTHFKSEEEDSLGLSLRPRFQPLGLGQLFEFASRPSGRCPVFSSFRAAMQSPHKHPGRKRQWDPSEPYSSLFHQ